MRDLGCPGGPHEYLEMLTKEMSELVWEPAGGVGLLTAPESASLPPSHEKFWVAATHSALKAFPRPFRLVTG